MNFREEAECVEKTVATSNVTRQPVGENQPQMKLGEGVKGVYISVDLDCMDSAFAPRESHTELGSLSFHDVLNIRHNLQADVVGADVVEFNPQRDTVDGMTAMVAAKLVRELTAKISK
ncbi:hypothetical protein P3L10_015044 [Capsicum annuum]